MKKVLKFLTKFMQPKDIANTIKDKLQKLEYSDKLKGKFLDKLFSYEVKNTVDDSYKIYNDLFKRWNK